MSRCKACNTILNDYDLKRKDKLTGEFLDLCGLCYSESQEALYDAQSECEQSIYTGNMSQVVDFYE